MMYMIKHSQRLPLTPAECWKFFSNPKNLQEITPAHMNFQILNDLSPGMYAGQIISYTVSPVFNYPLKWVTEITHVDEPHYFIDEQRFGPYAFWHHEHRFTPTPEGTEMHDTVYYKLRWGIFGRLLHKLFIKKQLEAIFAYRKEKLAALFGSEITS